MSEQSIQGLGANIRGIALAATVEAQRQGLVIVEAEHVLLALAAETRTSVGRLLAEHDLDHAGVLKVLADERERSLSAVGVSLRNDARLVATRLAQRPRWGASARNVFERGQKVSSGVRRGPNKMTAADLLAGVFSLELGTVPRALMIAGLDRVELFEAAKQLGH